MNQTILLALEETSSRDKSLISQGLDRLETLLTQICLSNDSETASFSSDKSRAVSFMSSSQVTDFLDSQDSFMYNIASRLVPVLSFLATAQESSSLIAQTLDIIHGLCLVHYRSRECFVTSDSMKLLISFLDNPLSTTQVKIACIGALVSVMVHQVESIRKFEDLGGLKTICTVFKRKETPKDVKLRILEFLFFYLIPETQSSNHPKSQALARKSTEDKQQLLANYLSNVKNLVRELQYSKPFGEIDVEW